MNQGKFRLLVAVKAKKGGYFLLTFIRVTPNVSNNIAVGSGTLAKLGELAKPLMPVEGIHCMVQAKVALALSMLIV